eukprot:15470263-Alexandrium_andersonii.AAC.1
MPGTSELSGRRAPGLVAKRSTPSPQASDQNVTPLNISADQGHVKVVELLLEARVDMDQAHAPRSSGGVGPHRARTRFGLRARVSD